MPWSSSKSAISTEAVRDLRVSVSQGISKGLRPTTLSSQPAHKVSQSITARRTFSSWWHLTSVNQLWQSVVHLPFTVESRIRNASQRLWLPHRIATKRTFAKHSFQSRTQSSSKSHNRGSELARQRQDLVRRESRERVCLVLLLKQGRITLLISSKWQPFDKKRDAGLYLI